MAVIEFMQRTDPLTKIINFYFFAFTAELCGTDDFCIAHTTALNAT